MTDSATIKLHRRALAVESWPDMLREFDAKFRHHARSVPGVPPAEVVALRRRLIGEESAELLEAIDAGDLAGVAKEACDAIYVVLGTMLAFGIDPGPIFRAVHVSNMTKDPAKDAGGKSLKGANYQAPDVPDLLRLQGWPGPPDPAPADPDTSPVITREVPDA